MYSTTLSSVQIKIKKVCNTWDFHQALNYLHLRGDWLKCPSRTSLFTNNVKRKDGERLL